MTFGSSGENPEHRTTLQQSSFGDVRWSRLRDLIIKDSTRSPKERPTLWILWWISVLCPHHWSSGSESPRLPHLEGHSMVTIDMSANSSFTTSSIERLDGCVLSFMIKSSTRQDNSHQPTLSLIPNSSLSYVLSLDASCLSVQLCWIATNWIQIRKVAKIRHAALFVKSMLFVHKRHCGQE